MANIPGCVYSSHFLYPFVHQWTREGYSQTLATVNNVAVNMEMYVSFQYQYPEVELLGHMVVLFFRGPSILFSIESSLVMARLR